MKYFEENINSGNRGETNNSNPFDQYAVDYDRWFDTPSGAEIFRRELDCLRPIVNSVHRRWLEVGCGTSRFASALGVSDGTAPSPAMVNISLTRRIAAVVADGENLPYSDNSFEGVLLICTICFLPEPEETLRECGRVLKNNGKLIIGFIPADSQWGCYNAEKGKLGHRFYSHARFYVPDEIKKFAGKAGFDFESAMSCRLPEPGDGMEFQTTANESFMILAFRKGETKK